MKRWVRVQKIKTQLESNYGIGKIQSKLICNQLGISSGLRNGQIKRALRPTFSPEDLASKRRISHQSKIMTKYEKKRVMDYLRKRTRVINNWAPSQDPYFVHQGVPSQGPPFTHSGPNYIPQSQSSKNVWLSNLSKFNKLPIVDNLKYIERNIIQNMIQKNTYRGFRHKKGLTGRKRKRR